MISVAIAVSLLAPSTCPASDAKEELLSLHEIARQAHLRGDAAPLAATTGDQLLLAEDGVLRSRTNAEVRRFFTGYFKRVRYRQWRDVSPPIVAISPDGKMAWMAVAIEARYTSVDKAAEGEKTFKSSWIATYARDKCVWRMTAIASDVVE
jgi:hypothetical protein